MHACSVVSDSATLWTVAPLFIELSRQEYWNGWPFPPPGDIPDSRTEPTSALAGRFSTTEPLGRSLARRERANRSVKCKDDNFKKAMWYNIFGMRLWCLKDRSGSEPELWLIIYVSWKLLNFTQLQGEKRNNLESKLPLGLCAIRKLSG